MRSSLYFLVLTHLLFTLSCFHFVANSPNFKQPLCHDLERLALMQFNQSIVIDESASRSPSAYPKTATWKLQESSDCCSWDGVECDKNNGYVIGLDLSSSFVYGSINSSSSLFRLIHLQKLNLAFNNFNYSQIPSEISHLSSLTYLNLSRSSFSGQIPLEISRLSKLTSLDLGFNLDSSFNRLLTIPIEKKLLTIQKPTLNSLIQNLTGLTFLGLSQVKISAALPNTLSNLSSLETLYLTDCELQGEFPTGVFGLPNLESLSVWVNPNLTGYFPEFNKSSLLNFLRVGGTKFSGKLPDSINKLKFLAILDVSECAFSGLIPSSLGNLTHLMALDLSFNSFNMSNGGTLTWLGKQTQLTFLNLEGINFNNRIPSFLANMTALASLNLGSNSMTGYIPSWLGNLTQLTELRLGHNQLQGPIPKTFSRLVNLKQISVEFNFLNGTVELDMFLNLTYLLRLQLSYNSLTLLPQQTSVNGTTIQKFVTLGLANCNLDQFPEFLRYQYSLRWLDLGTNKINGTIPKWMFNVGKESLLFIALCFNSLTGFEQHPTVLPWKNARILDLRVNLLQGSVPLPPPFAYLYQIAGNLLTGEISPSFCNLTSLYVLDLSYNKLSGMLPQCLDQLSDSLSIMNLQENNFQGTIPELCMKGSSKLNMIQFNQNRFQGPLPKSLANCEVLQYLDLGNNQINDTFPKFLGTLPELRVLFLRSNRFHGAIGSPEVTKFQLFPKLCVIDLSNNSFTGKLPTEYFKIWNSMKTADVQDLPYLRGAIILQIPALFSYSNYYDYGMVLTNKGTKRAYAKLPLVLTGIDLSGNRFEGDIPESIASLKALKMLNLSDNILVGRIPSWIGNLTALESLDLSQNMLSGEIPQQLAHMSFLSVLNISHNNLTGPIPAGEQFVTFPNTSFEGNPGLCGEPLSKKCETSDVPPSPPSTSEGETDSEFPSGYDWFFILAGCGSGFIIGFVVGNIIYARTHVWFAETFGKVSLKKKKKQRENTRRQRTYR